MYEPFEALHLDWYSTAEDAYTQTSSAAISHWNNDADRAGHLNEPLQYTAFKAVEVTQSELNVVDIEVSTSGCAPASTKKH